MHTKPYSFTHQFNAPISTSHQLDLSNLVLLHRGSLSECIVALEHHLDEAAVTLCLNDNSTRAAGWKMTWLSTGVFTATGSNCSTLFLASHALSSVIITNIHRMTLLRAHMIATLQTESTGSAAST